MSLKRQLPLPLNQSNPERAPDILPPTIEELLSKAVRIPLSCIEDLWDILEEHLWSASPALFFGDNLTLFKEHAWPLELMISTLTLIWEVDHYLNL
jgi:hypothetical protein